MNEDNKSASSILSALKERAKELNCLYKIEELLAKADAEPESLYQGIAEAIPSGWQYAENCAASLKIENREYRSAGFSESTWKQEAAIMVHGDQIGKVTVYYTEQKPEFEEGPFLKEERRLINTIADRIGQYIFHHRLKTVFNELQSEEKSDNSKPEWRVLLDLLKETDHSLFKLISRKMLIHLCWRGIKDAEKLLHSTTDPNVHPHSDTGENLPSEIGSIYDISDEIYFLAEKNLNSEEILFRIQKWLLEDRSSFLVSTLENQDTNLPEIAEAIRRFYLQTPDAAELPPSSEKGLRVSMIRRFLSDQLDFISIAKDYVKLKDFYEILQRMIYPSNSRGKIGGKSVGLFLADKILKKHSEEKELLKNIKIPKTWYITSDEIIEFLHYNNLEEVIEQKYKETDQIRQEYPYIVQIFKNSNFPADIVNAISSALDDFGNCPLIVRSSSLLEDRMGAAFSGKYKSLFVANQGPKQHRLAALLDAIAEVYASVFSPDPIEYRAERGLLDFNEEMGIMIQEVVGKRVGKYFFPSYSGVAFSNNEFRWSPRIKRDDGLIRIVPGLGTRAVDRVSDDYPILIAPGKPGLRVNITPEEVIRYSTKKIDYINLEKNSFETGDIKEILDLYGSEYPAITNIVSAYEHDQIKRIIELDIDNTRSGLVVTFDGLFNNTSFISRIQAIMNILKEKMNTPVDIEFACDGDNFYLLQCRPQSYTKESMPSPIPKDIPEKNIVFTAGKYVSNGKVPDITHIIYVDPENYTGITDLAGLKMVGKVVGKLNKLLPKRQFILMGPGRWGSRGDIKMGVNVTYSDINNTAVLIEIAKKKGNYVPDLSFGTHFFQDLVESSIRYLPLYPDDPGIIFNSRFFSVNRNILTDILPDHSNLQNVIKVIDVPESTGGNILKVLMNAELDEAIGYLSTPTQSVETERVKRTYTEPRSEDHWRWRYRMAEKIASQLDPLRFGVKAFYLIGSTKNIAAGPGSDIDIIIHVNGTQEQKKELELWIEGWSLCISELNFLRTGYRVDKILDTHFITDEDIKNKTSYAIKIGAVTDPARELPMMKVRH